MKNEMTNHRHRRLGRPPKSEAIDTQQAILDAARNLFARQGFAGTSIRHITRAVQISEAAFYAHFTSKDELFQVMLQEGGPTNIQFLLARSIEERPDLMDEPTGFLREFVRRVLERWAEPPARQYISIFLREGLVDPSTNNNTEFIASIHQALQQLGGLFQKWMKTGMLRDDVSSQMLAWEFLSPMIHARLLWMHWQTTEEVFQEGQQLIRNHLEYFLQMALRLQNEED